MPDQLSKLALERFTSFGDLLKFLRRRSSLTQRELSIAVGYSHAQISRLELNQRQPDLATIAARFIPVLDLEEEPQVAERLLELAAELSQRSEPAPGDSPYKGLQFFDETDAGRFFGREELTRRLVKRLGERLAAEFPLRFMAIVGASGGGKSSLMRAGLIPALRRTPAFSRWQVCSFTPTESPLQALSASLNRNSASVIATAALIDDMGQDQRALHLTVARISSSENRLRHPEGVLLFIDQFEELFTLCQGESERGTFIDNLITAASEPGGKTFIVLALRADFYSRCAPYARLRDALAEHQEYIGAMTASELRRAMEEPAKQGEWQLEPGLAELLLADVGAEGDQPPEPGALPLMSHALLETWRRRQGRRLTVSGYLATGGVSGAIAHTADDVFQNELDETEQAIARNIFLRLTQLGEDNATADARRRATFNELIHIPEDEPEVREVLTKLANARLITTDNEVVEISHEALIREWPTLREWLEEDREGLRLHRHLTVAAEGWERHDRDPGELYRGARLAGAIAWAGVHSSSMSRLEEAFLEASKKLAGSEEAEREATRQRELEAAKALAQTQQQAAAELRKRAMYLTTAFVLAVSMALTALYFGSQARQTAVTAQNERRIATSRELAAASLNNLTVDPELSILLALQSVSTTRSVDGSVMPESVEALHRAVVTSPIRMTLGSHGTGVLSATYRPDGKQFSTIGADGTVILWDAMSGAELNRLPGATQPGDMVTVRRIGYSPDGFLLAACDSDQVKIYDPATGALLQTLRGYQGDATAVAFRRDGKLIASGSLGGRIFIWDVTTGGLLLDIAAHTDAIEGVVFSPDGRWLISSSDDATMKIWDAVKGELLQSFTYDGVVGPVTFSPDGTRFAFDANDGLHVWQFDEETSGILPLMPDQEILTIPGGMGVVYSPDGGRLAAVTGGSGIKVWNALTGEELLTLVGHTDWVMGLAFSPDGSQLVSTSLDGSVKVWNLAPGNETVVVSAPTAGFGTRIVFSPTGREFATNGGDVSATLWNAETGEPRLRLAGHKLEVLSVAFSSDGKRFATGSLDGTAIVWDTASGEQLYSLEKHEFGVRDIAFSPDGQLIATGGFDGTAKVWEAASGKLLLTITGHAGLVVGVAFNSDGSNLATASTDGTMKIWEVKTGALLLTLAGHENAIPDVSFSPDGSKIVSGGKDTRAKIWDAATGKELFTLAGHNSEIQSVAFSPDGKLIATGSGDNTAKIWDVETGKEILSLPGSRNGVYGVAFSPLDNGAHLLVASNDGIVRMFLLRVEDILALAESRVTRTLLTQECQRYLHMEQCPN